MFVTALGTATPPHCYTKSECWDAFVKSEWFERLTTRSRAITRAVLQGDNGIETRFLAVENLEEVFHIDPNTLQQRFELHAPRLASEAAATALERAGLRPEQIDAVIVSTCTGYLCPGLSGYVGEQLALRKNVRGYDMVGQGCAAALPNWQLASALLDSGQCEHVLSICVEICSAAMYLDDDPGVLISACLFGDGAGAAVLSRRRSGSGRAIQWRHTASLTDPVTRQALRFEQRDGLLRNVLSPAVPRLAAGYAHEVFLYVLATAQLQPADVSTWIFHAGGRDVLLAIEQQFALSSGAHRYSSDTLRLHGNLSSAFVYFVLEAALADNAPGGWWWMSSFGAGFSCHGALLSVD
ncbi:MAG: 3-oxoacyl-[acyl-carrier-protein] synthase III C-terminal domain-containing protein [Steroidobacteraceae bacterium]